MQYYRWNQLKGNLLDIQAYVEKELGFCEVEHVACGSGLERIYRFMQTDELCNRPQLDLDTCKVPLPSFPLYLKPACCSRQPPNATWKLVFRSFLCSPSSGTLEGTCGTAVASSVVCPCMLLRDVHSLCARPFVGHLKLAASGS